jgi:tRNA (adenine22-N1)-methyltransferase
MGPLAPPLSPRLAALADAIVPASRVADVGTDHGLLPLWLAATGRASYCLATEKTAVLLDGVARPKADAPWALLLDYRAGDGLDALRPDDRIDTIVLAGLGGRTVVRLLAAPQASSPAVRRLVLQPRSEPARTRLWLSKHGWRPVAERLTEDRGRLHLTIAAERGPDFDLYRHETLSREDLLTAGPLLVRFPTAEMQRLWRDERDRLASIVARARQGPSSARARSGMALALRVLAAISRPVE